MLGTWGIGSAWYKRACWSKLFPLSPDHLVVDLPAAGVHHCRKLACLPYEVSLLRQYSCWRRLVEVVALSDSEWGPEKRPSLHYVELLVTASAQRDSAEVEWLLRRKPPTVPDDLQLEAVYAALFAAVVFGQHRTAEVLLLNLNPDQTSLTLPICGQVHPSSQMYQLGVIYGIKDEEPISFLGLAYAWEHFSDTLPHDREPHHEADHELNRGYSLSGAQYLGMLHLLLEYGVQPASSAEGLLQRLTSTADMAAVMLLQRFGLDVEDCGLSDGRTMLHLLVSSRFLANRVAIASHSSSENYFARPAQQAPANAGFGQHSAAPPNFGFGAASSHQATAASFFGFGRTQDTLAAPSFTPEELALFETNVKDWQDQAAPLMQLLLTKECAAVKRDNSNKTPTDICLPEYTQFLSAMNIAMSPGQTGAPDSHEQGQARCVICLDRRPTVVIIPCGHLCVCQQCSCQLIHPLFNRQPCPVCRETATQWLQTYQS